MARITVTRLTATYTADTVNASKSNTVIELTWHTPQQIACAIETVNALENCATIADLKALDLQALACADTNNASAYSQKRFWHIHKKYDGAYTYTRTLEDGTEKVYPRRVSVKSLIEKYAARIVLLETSETIATELMRNCAFKGASAAYVKRTVARELDVSVSTLFTAKSDNVSNADIAHGMQKRMSRAEKRRARAEKRRMAIVA